MVSWTSPRRPGLRVTYADEGFLFANKLLAQGRPLVGRTLQVDTGVWPKEPNRFTFRWFAGPFELYGADHQQLVLKRRHAGARIRAMVIPLPGGVRYVPANTPRSAQVEQAG